MNLILIGFCLWVLYNVHIMKKEERRQKDRIKKHGEFLKAIKEARRKND